MGLADMLVHVRSVLATLIVTTFAAAAPVNAQSTMPPSTCGGEIDRTPLAAGQRLFYNGEYEQTAALTGAACSALDTLALCELRTSALLFDIKKTIGNDRAKDKALKACARCPALLTLFVDDTRRGLALARAKLETEPDDQVTRFLLAKLDLNYVWLQLGILGRKTGWGEYWEARRSLDKVLASDPDHLRARVARAWIDYIVDTRMPMGTRWLLGGGNKKRGLLTMEQAAQAEGDFYARTEAGFALWDVQTREKKLADAVITARRLACDFPENQELRRFLEGAAPH